jgi:hypothetical protein
MTTVCFHRLALCRLRRSPGVPSGFRGMQYKFLQWDAKSAVPRVVSVVAAQLGPISPNSLPGTSHAYQVYSGTFVLGILWHSLHQAFASSAWACPQSTSPVAFRTFAGVCFCWLHGRTAARGEEGAPVQCSSIAGVTGSFLLHSQPCMHLLFRCIARCLNCLIHAGLLVRTKVP